MRFLLCSVIAITAILRQLFKAISFFVMKKIKSVNSANKLYEHLEQKVDKCYSNDD